MQLISPIEAVVMSAILLIIWIVISINKTEELSNKDRVLIAKKRLITDFKRARDLEQLERIYYFIDTIVESAKAVMPDHKEVYRDLIKEFYNRQFDLVNIEAPGVPQSLLPFLTVR